MKDGEQRALVMSAMVSAASSSMALGAAPVHSVVLTRSFSEKISRSVMLIPPFSQASLTLKVG